MFWNQHELGHQPGVKKVKKVLDKNSIFDNLAEICIFSAKFGKSENWAMKLNRNFSTHIYL